MVIPRKQGFYVEHIQLVKRGVRIALARVGDHRSVQVDADRVEAVGRQPPAVVTGPATHVQAAPVFRHNVAAQQRVNRCAEWEDGLVVLGKLGVERHQTSRSARRTSSI